MAGEVVVLVGVEASGGSRAIYSRFPTGDTVANFLYVDNSNVWIEGMHVSAVAKGIAPDIWTAMESKIVDYGWKMDFGKLYEFADGDPTGCSNLYGSRPPANDSLWAVAKAKGFDVTVHDRNASNREKKVDTTIARDIMKHSFERMKAGTDTVTLVAGDADYVPVVEDVVSRGIRFDVVFWDHASGELKRAASKFIPLDPHLDYLALK
jgi:uncharacterized LabA/DUF88 family protein